MIRSNVHRQVVAKVTGQPFVETTAVELQPGQTVVEAPGPGETLVAVVEGQEQAAQSLRERFADGGLLPPGEPYIVGERGTCCAWPRAMFARLPVADGSTQAKPVTQAEVALHLDHTEDDNIILGPADGDLPEPDLNDVGFVPAPGGSRVLVADVRPQDGHVERAKRFTISVAEAERRVRALGVPSARVPDGAAEDCSVPMAPQPIGNVAERCERDRIMDVVKAAELGLPVAAYRWINTELKLICDRLDTYRTVRRSLL